MSHRYSPTLLPVAVISTLFLSGCVGGPGTSATTPTHSAAAPSTPSATPSTSISPNPSTEPITCQTIVTPAALTKLTTPPSEWVADYGAGGFDGIQQRFIDYGGVMCMWGPPNSDNVFILGFSPITDVHAAEVRAELQGLGWTKSTPSVGVERWTGPDDGSGFTEIYEFRPGNWRYALDTASLDYFSV